MVGQQTLDLPIGVRIPASQNFKGAGIARPPLFYDLTIFGNSPTTCLSPTREPRLRETPVLPHSQK